MKVIIFFLFVLVVSIGLAGCSSDNSTSNSTQVPSVQTVNISISGVNVMNSTIAPGEGNSTLFSAFPSRVEPGLQVMMQFRTPSMMGGMRSQMMYDDGTHGDRVAGDGQYCYEDVNGNPGMHMQNAMMGNYNFEFYCENSKGDHSSHMNAWVDVR